MYILTNSDFRKRSREQLKGNWTQVVLATLVTLIISAIIYSFIPVVSFALVFPFEVMLLRFLGVFRIGQKANIEELFHGLDSYYIKSFLVSLVLGCIYFAIAIIPTIIIVILFIAGEYQIHYYYEIAASGIVLALIIMYLYLYTRFSLVKFVVADNNGLDIKGILKYSSNLTKGRKWRIISLYLSFIGWWLLVFLTVGIGMLWLVPYIDLTMMNFYEEIKNDSENIYL
jgi:uncharacterized membrane protein